MGRAVAAFLPCVPPTVTHNDLEAYTLRRGGRVRAAIRKSDRLKAAEDTMRPLVERMAASAGGSLPLRGALSETVKVCWPTEGRHEQGEPRTDPPDLDNWVKSFNDLCQGAGIMGSDAQVAELRAVKAWADPCGVYVRFEEVGN